MGRGAAKEQLGRGRWWSVFGVSFSVSRLKTWADHNTSVKVRRRTLSMSVGGIFLDDAFNSRGSQYANFRLKTEEMHFMPIGVIALGVVVLWG